MTGAAQLAVLDAPSQLGSSPYLNFIRVVPGATSTTIKRIKSLTTAEAADAFLYAMTSEPVEFKRTEIGQLLDRLPESAEMTLEEKRKWFERTFDSQMARLTAGYRSRIRWWAALAGLIIAFGFGLDAIGLTERLYADPAQRAVLIAEADKVAEPGVTCEAENGDDVECETLEARLDAARDAARDLNRLEVSLWQLDGDNNPDDSASWLRAVAGMLLTAAAIAAGAPFWFDVLRRLMGLRSGAAAPTA